MTDKINFSIPGFYQNNKLNKIFLEFIRKTPELLNDDVCITSCYDSFPCIWNGGRVSGGFCDKDTVEEAIKTYNDFGLSLRYTFTNKFISGTQVYDTICNQILKITLQSQAINTGINVNSPELRDYLLKEYPDFYYLISTTVSEKSIEEINQLSKDFIVVPNYSINNSYEMLNKLDNRENIEILVAEPCIDDCSVRMNHYEHIAKNQMWEEKIVILLLALTDILTFMIQCKEGILSL